MRALPVDVVRALIAIVDCRGFTRAADQLFEPADLQRDRRLGAPKLLGGAGEPPAIDDSDQGPDDVDGKRAHCQ